MRFIKVVRDRAGHDSDVAVYAHIQERQQFLRGLRAKLSEEVHEYIEDQNVEELADIYEVVMNLARYGHGLHAGNLKDIADHKFGKKGGFVSWVGLFLKREGEE
jgi:predicted house-cleaning noncanonical NTP pyrophosphatase (MazG superfamily)